jgi:hypothetical protein
MCVYVCVCVCVCVAFTYPACSAHAPYCHLWSVWFYNIFPYYLIKGTFFDEEEKRNIKCVFWFALQLSSETYLILRRTERVKTINININWSSCKVPSLLSLNNKTSSLWRNLRKISSIKFHENPSSGSRNVPCWRKDGQTDITKQIDAFPNYANASKNCTLCPTASVCFASISEQTATFAVYNINWFLLPKWKVFTARYEMDL